MLKHNVLTFWSINYRSGFFPVSCKIVYPWVKTRCSPVSRMDIEQVSWYGVTTVEMLALCASFVYSLFIYLLQAIYEKQVQNGHAEDINVIHIILTELFCLRLLQNTAPAYQPLLCPYIHYFITSTLYWRNECSFPSYGMQQTPWLGTTLKTEKQRILNWNQIYNFWNMI